MCSHTCIKVQLMLLENDSQDLAKVFNVSLISFILFYHNSWCYLGSMPPPSFSEHGESLISLKLSPLRLPPAEVLNVFWAV